MLSDVVKNEKINTEAVQKKSNKKLELFISSSGRSMRACFHFCLCSIFGENVYATAYAATTLDAKIDLMNKLFYTIVF